MREPPEHPLLIDVYRLQQEIMRAIGNGIRSIQKDNEVGYFFFPFHLEEKRFIKLIFRRKLLVMIAFILRSKMMMFLPLFEFVFLEIYLY